MEDDFPLLSYASVLRALNASNAEAGAQLFDWRTVSSAKAVVKSDGGMVLDAEPLDRNDRARRSNNTDHFLVLLSNVKDNSKRKLVVTWVRENLARGAKILSVSSGTKLLCEAGVMDGKRCALHWSDFGASVEKYPRAIISRAFYEIDGSIVTCAGELATFDAVLRLLSPELTSALIDQISARCLQTTAKGQSERQSLPAQIQLERMNSPLLRVVDLMEENIVDPLPVVEIFKNAKISRRQAERLFEKQMGTSPKRYYLQLRLQRAHDLLLHTPMMVSEIAAATGFLSNSNFSKAFKLAFGMLPLTIRRLSSDCSRTELPPADVTLNRPGNDNGVWSRCDRVGASNFTRRHSMQGRAPRYTPTR